MEIHIFRIYPSGRTQFIMNSFCTFRKNNLNIDFSPRLASHSMWLKRSSIKNAPNNTNDSHTLLKLDAHDEVYATNTIASSNHSTDNKFDKLEPTKISNNNKAISSSSAPNSTINDTIIIATTKSNGNETDESDPNCKMLFFNKIMHKLGMMTCPIKPPNLIGPIDVDANYESLQSVEARFHGRLLDGGWYKPTDCVARDRVAIVVPYRDRASQLPIFLKNIHPFLMKQQIEYGIFIIEQTADNEFNRASLLNVGFKEALKLHQWDCFIFHDVDLLPLDDRNLYTCPDQPRHMSVAVDTFGFR